jgi:glc operon protein GlcG
MANFPTKKVLTLDAAKQAAAASTETARTLGCNMAIAIVDDGAHLVYLERMDGTQIGSVPIAQEKAQAAVRFKRPTKFFEDAIAGGRMVALKLTGTMPIEGGIPIVADGEVIGGIGVSGGSSTQDGQVAQAGIAALS